MSCVCILTPIVIAAWPAFSAAVVAAATSLGYEIASDQMNSQTEPRNDSSRHVALEIAQSELVTDSLGRDQQISVTRDGLVVTFSRDARGRAALCVSGSGRSDDELRALGEELGRRVVQQYVYQRLKNEIRARQFVVVEEETDAGNAIRLKVRHWEN